MRTIIIITYILSSSLVWAASLEGKFVKKCEQIHPDFPIYQMKEIIFYAKKYILNNYKYENDPKCKKPVSQVTLEVDYKLKKTKIKNQYHADLLIRKYFVTALTKEDAAHKTDEKFCDLKWTVNQKVEATNLPCGADFKNRAIFHLLNLEKDTLYLGMNTESNDGSSAKTRPNILDLNNPYIKK